MIVGGMKKLAQSLYLEGHLKKKHEIPYIENFSCREILTKRTHLESVSFFAISRTSNEDI